MRISSRSPCGRVNGSHQVKAMFADTSELPRLYVWGGRTKSTEPAEIAFVGISGHWAAFRVLAKVIPACGFYSFLKPNVPSDPVPERMMPMAALLCSSAKATANPSIGWWDPRLPRWERAAGFPHGSSYFGWVG